MFAIDPHFLKSVFYLYPSEPEAREGMRVGGSGFVVGVPSRHEGSGYPHLVTNKHVVDGGNHFVRWNAKDGKTVVVATRPDEWVTSFDDDLAVLGTDLPDNIDFVAIGTDLFLDDNGLIEGWSVLPGDEVVFAGRFVEHDGRQQNKPLYRFGNISMLPDADAPVDMGATKQAGFLVECRSLSGFSGSPAFVRLAGSRWVGPDKRDQTGWIPTTSIKMLGVDCGHFPFWSRVREAPRADARTLPDMYADTNSGMAIVIPASRLMNLINQEPLASARESLDRKLDEEAASSQRASDE